MAAASASVWRAWPPGVDLASARFDARAFGVEAADLDIDFTQARPFAISTLLANCVRRRTSAAANDDTAWHWHIADRLQALLAILYASGTDALQAHARCSQAQCQQDIELELPLANFVHHALAETAIGTGGDRIALRLPTGDDQRRWQIALDRSEVADGVAVRRYARDLVVAINAAPPPADWQPAPDLIDAIGDALDALDPLTALRLPVACPYCQTTIALDIDLEALALARLHRLQLALLEDVHQLARAYSWSERAIADLPRWRRAHYRARLDAELP